MKTKTTLGKETVLITNTESEQIKGKSEKNIFSGKPKKMKGSRFKYYFNLIGELNKYIQIAFWLSITLLIYGFTVRILDFYLFWEAKHLGFLLFLICSVIILIKDIKVRISKHIKTTRSYVKLVIVILILVIKISLINVLDDYSIRSAAEKHLISTKELKEEIGRFQVIYLPSGSYNTEFGYTEISVPYIYTPKQKAEAITLGYQLATHSIHRHTKKSATVNLLLKGRKKYKEVTLSLNNMTDTGKWQVVFDNY